MTEKKEKKPVPVKEPVNKDPFNDGREIERKSKGGK